MASFKYKFGEKTHEIEPKSTLNILSRNEDHWVVKYGNKIYHAEILSFDVASKSYKLFVDNTEVTVQLLDEVDQLVDDMGMNDAVAIAIDKMLAPMPGLVIEVMVNIGDEVKEGDPILIVEAMKMENVLKSPGDGIVKTIIAEKGKTVDKNELLIEFE